MSLKTCLGEMSVYFSFRLQTKTQRIIRNQQFVRLIGIYLFQKNRFIQKFQFYGNIISLRKILSKYKTLRVT